jgi:flagellar hook-associated protein 1 FlgK
MSRISLSTGLRALLTAQFGLDTVGQNISNANTEGYSRQRVDLAAGLPQRRGRFLIGSGVEVAGIQRQVDALLERRILAQRSVTGRLEQESSTLSEMEALFADLEGFGLGTAMDDFFSDLTQLSTNPQDTILQTGLVQATLELTARFNALDGGLGDLGAAIVTQAEVLTGEIDQLAAEIARLNGEISSVESGQVVANDLRDRRQVKLQQLAQIVDISTAETERGEVRVQVAGNILVNGTSAQRMSVVVDADNRARIKLSSSSGFVPVQGGQLGGLINVREGSIPGLRSNLDRLARAMITQLNRVHSTGLPSSGPMTSLLSSNAAKDIDGDGKVEDELLSSAFPFPVVDGTLTINVEELASGEVQSHSVEIDAARMTIAQFLQAVEDVPNLSAELDAFGRVQIVADAGYGFDFSNRLDPNPDPQGVLGGGHASLGTPNAGPFTLADGDDLQLTVPNPLGGSTVVQVEFDATQFVDITEASAAEVAAVINANPDVTAAGLRAVVQGGYLFLQTEGTGAAATFEVSGGSAVAGLGLEDLEGIPQAGAADAVELQLSGSYSGAQNGRLSFVPRGDGQIGTTPGLTLDVFDENGELVTSLDVGAGYQPGTKLQVFDGLEVSLGLGHLSAQSNDRLEVELVADSDESDVLVATGLNALLTGTDAASIGVRVDIQNDPALLAGAGSHAEGDNQRLLDLIDLQGEPIAELGGYTFGAHYSNVVGEFGFELGTTNSALAASNVLTENLADRRAAVSGVNVDEEVVSMLRFEQAYNAAARFIDVVNQLQDELLQIL